MNRIRISIQFWSSVILTGNQTSELLNVSEFPFWSSVILTGNQTEDVLEKESGAVLEQCHFDW